MEQLVARQAHNLEVARSSRTPATTKREEAIGFLLSLLAYFRLEPHKIRTHPALQNAFLFW